MRHIKIGSLTLLAGGTRLEREEEMGECQSAACFIETAIRDTQTHDSGVLLTQLRTAPRFALSEVQLIGGKSMAEQLLSALLMERQELPTVLDMARQAAFRMAPKPGRVVLSAVLSITASVEVDVGLEAVEEVAHTILQGISEDENIDFVLGGMERSDKGASFVLATAERLVKGGNTMTYVMSDIHGHYDKYREMLETIEFAADDTLYVLGDVLDRGSDGFKTLLDMTARPNVIGLLGNHELLAAAVLPSLLRTMRQGEEQPLSEPEQEQMREWIQNGGKASILQFLQLGGEEIETVCEYLPELSAYEEVTVQGRQFLLVHAGLEHFSPARSLEEYDLEDFLFCRPNLDAAYFPDKTLVFGHTPTRLLYQQIGELGQPDRIFHRGMMIGIDCGCAYPGGRLGCLCLDTMEEFYV